jgi:hypothetical protein
MRSGLQLGGQWAEEAEGRNTPVPAPPAADGLLLGAPAAPQPSGPGVAAGVTSPPLYQGALIGLLLSIWTLTSSLTWTELKSGGSCSQKGSDRADQLAT